MRRVIFTMLFLLLPAACSDPCYDYCEAFVARTSECGLGGPSGDGVAEQCGEDVSDVLTDDACDNARENIERMSCSEFAQLVCSTPDGPAVYNCP